MTDQKASALAHPIQGLIKYHGLRNEELRLPYQDSISVCIAPYQTHTTIAFSPDFSDSVEIDGKERKGRERERVIEVVDYLRRRGDCQDSFRLLSKNNFTSNIGLGASSSGFAALALSAASALGLEMTDKEISRVARLGAGSAARAVTGAFSYWKGGQSHQSSYSYQLADENHVPLVVFVVPIKAYKETESAHREAVTSPLFQARLPYAREALCEMEDAILARNVSKIGWLAEYDTLNLHAITMSGKSGSIYWRPDTLRIMLAVRELREEEIEAYFSIDTGATVYINTTEKYASQVEEKIKSLDLPCERGTIGGPARITEDHLF